jgi:signal transduction histidine kinase
MEAGAVEVRPAVVRLEQVLEPAIESARSEALDKGLSLSVDYDPDLDVEIDPLLTRSAIQNLADNAVKYTDTGRVQITVDHEGDTFQIHVRDDCHGLSREELETMFEPFKRGETGKAGTGLGLAIAKRAVEAQGGSIHAESPPPSGCHFWITLPKKPKA